MSRQCDKKDLKAGKTYFCIDRYGNKYKGRCEEGKDGKLYIINAIIPSGYYNGEENKFVGFEEVYDTDIQKFDCGTVLSFDLTGTSKPIKRQLETGDIVVIKGVRYIVDKILSQEPWSWDNTWHIEFKDPDGHYHFWKQKFDGGTAYDRNTGCEILAYPTALIAVDEI